MEKRKIVFYALLTFGITIFFILNFFWKLEIDPKISRWLITPSVNNHYRILIAASGSSSYEYWKKLGEEMFGRELLSRLEADENKTKKEIVMLENFLKREGPNPNILSRLGILYKQIGEMKTAEFYLEKAHSIDPLTDR